MTQTLRCPGCGAAFDAKTGSIREGGVQCPSCLTTVPVFEEDTWVPGRPRAESGLEQVELEIEGYEILNPLGQGGMGAVLEGKQISLGRRVAIKVLSPALARDDSFVERFEREAAALARLAHPNIVTIIERGKSADSVYFIMEYVEGVDGEAPTDLRAVLNERALSTGEVKHFVTQVARALAYAHENGIIHRDIKPGNVMIDRHGNAKVADFGIASIANQQLDSRLTAPSAGMGTLDYMAPEQRDNAATVDQRADVYSLGVLLYEMLTGKLPRGAYSPASKIVPGIDPGWDKLIAQALQPQAEDRLPSMNAFIEHLEKISVSDRAFVRRAG